MKQEYRDWIHKFAESKGGRVVYQCQEGATKMAEAFPELKIVKGFALPSEEGREGLPIAEMELEDRQLVWDPKMPFLNQHWWCVTGDGEVVDPTAAQFDWPTIIYVPHDEAIHGPCPTNKCMNCGEMAFTKEFSGACTKKCELSFGAYLEEENKQYDSPSHRSDVGAPDPEDDLPF